METALRLSEDLRNSTERAVVPNTRVNSGEKSGEGSPFNMYYPKFLSADGSSHYEIDESETVLYSCYETAGDGLSGTFNRGVLRYNHETQKSIAILDHAAGAGRLD